MTARKRNQEAYFRVQCWGRDETGDTVLDKPVTVQVRVHKNPDGDDLSSLVKCPYVGGGHNDRCNALDSLYPVVRVYSRNCSPVGAGNCAYSFSIPWVIDLFSKRDRK